MHLAHDCGKNDYNHGKQCHNLHLQLTPMIQVMTFTM
jgi:hypothetical protein